MKKLTLKTAAKMASESYSPVRGKIGGYHIQSTNKGHATAYYLAGDVLVIRGSDSAYDYIRYNLRPLGLGLPKLNLAGHMGPASDWHQGFMAHVLEIDTWLQRIKRRPKFVVGHSLGAATAQIISASLRIPAICFAPPRVCKKNVAGQSNRCLLVMRSDDIVPDVPSGYRHLGKKKRIEMGNVVGHKHKMDFYEPELTGEIAAGRIPQKWP